MGFDRRDVDRVSEVNILTATKLRWWPFQLLGFFIARRSRWAAEHLVRQSGLALHLKRLNFIHAARWTALGRFPKAGLSARQQESWRLRWVLFTSDFNQTWRPYFFAFLDSFGSGINTLWGESEGIPDYPLPYTRYRTLEWVDGQLPISDYYFAAYPEVSTNEVRCALRTAREVTAHERENETGELPLSDLPPALVRSLQPCLIPISPGTRRIAPGAGNDYDGNVGLVACFPLDPDRVVPTKQWLRSRYDSENDQFFSRVPGVHFARLFVIDRHRSTGAASVGLKNSWLVLSAIFDAEVAGVAAVRRELQLPRVPDEVIKDFAHRLHRTLQEEFTWLWDNCVGRSGPFAKRECAEILRAGTVRNLLVYHDYPDATRDEVTTALDRHRRLMQSAIKPIPAV